LAFLYNKITRKITLLLILFWSIVSFYFIDRLVADKVLITTVGLIAFLFIIFELAPLFIVIILSFTVSFALYGFLFTFNLPVWLLMIAILILFGYLFLYMEQKTGILGNKRLIYLLLFSILILEVFLALSYFIINPLSKSLIISAVTYIFIGFCYTVLAKHKDNSFSTYLYFFVFSLILIMIVSIAR